MFIWKATFIDFEENYHAYVYMRPTFIQHSRVQRNIFMKTMCKLQGNPRKGIP